MFQGICSERPFSNIVVPKAAPGRTSVKVARFFYDTGRKRPGIVHSTLLAEGCAFIEMQRLSLIVLC